MKGKGITILIIALMLVLAGMLVYDLFLKEKPIQSKLIEVTNKSEDSVHVKKSSDKSYQETFKRDMVFNKPAGLYYHNEQLFVSGDSAIMILNTEGKELNRLRFSDVPKNLIVRNDTFFVLFKNYVAAYRNGEDELFQTEKFNDRALFTSLTVNDDWLFVADAGNKKVFRFNLSGEKIDEFEGFSGNDILHGFIIPSPYFHLELNSKNELWVVNPGMHLLQQYTPKGDLENMWGETGMFTEGFSGCCNPAYFSFLPNGNFVTSEKGAVRVKIYSSKGEFLELVASGDDFKYGKYAPQPATDIKGNIWLLDFDKKQLRFFEKQN
jgi:hypothetical protein